MTASILQIDENGIKAWRLNGKLHREDGPAVEHSDGSQFWYLNGEHHREDGPAVEFPDGTKEWWLNDRRHREDGPAVEHPNGTKIWFLNNKFIVERERPENWNELVALSIVERVM